MKVQTTRHIERLDAGNPHGTLLDVECNESRVTLQCLDGWMVLVDESPEKFGVLGKV